MRCSDVRGAMVLAESGDATEQQNRIVAEHLTTCVDCGQFASAGSLPFHELRSQPPLREADFAAVRASVTARIREERRSPFLSSALAAAAMIVVLAGAGAFLVLRREQPQTIARTNPPQPMRIIATSQPVIAEAQPLSRSAVRKPGRHHVATPPPDDSEPELQIELQTDDPALRITWIVNPKLDPLPQEKSDEMR